MKVKMPVMVAYESDTATYALLLFAMVIVVLGAIRILFL